MQDTPVAAAPCVSAASFQMPAARPFSAWKTHGPFAFWLIEAHRPQTVVELGTHFGYSYLCFCQEISRLGLSAQCTAIDTFEGDTHAGFYGREVYEQLRAYHDPLYGRFSRLLRSTFDEATREFADGSIDLLHIDGRHFYDDVRHDFERWRPKLSRRAIVLFHDTQVTERDFGVWRLWQQLSKAYPSFEFVHGYGLGVLGVGPDAAALPLFAPGLTITQAQRIRRVYRTLGEAVESGQSFRRNDPCPCESGLRFKHCHGSTA